MTKHRSHYQERVTAQIHHVLAQAVATRLKDPRVRFVTVTAVTVSPNVTHATAQVSVMGGEKEKEEALQGLDSARGFLRSLLAKSLGLRTTPELRFALDRGLEHARHIDHLLAELGSEDKKS